MIEEDDDALKLLRHICRRASMRYGLIYSVGSPPPTMKERGIYPILVGTTIGGLKFKGTILSFIRAEIMEGALDSKQSINAPGEYLIIKKRPIRWDMADPSFDIDDVVDILYVGRDDRYTGTDRRILL